MERPVEVRETILTPRLRLAALRPEHAAGYHATVLDSQPMLAEWLSWAAGDVQVSSIANFCRRSYSQFILRDELHYVLLAPESEEVLGGCGFHTIDWEVPKLEIGYWLGRRWHGLGLMTEAIQALCDMARDELGVKRLVIRCDARNAKSCKVAERLGFTLEGTLRQELRTHRGELRDTLVYAWVE